MEILFDVQTLDYTPLSGVENQMATSNYVLIPPRNPAVGVLNQVVVTFDQPLTSATTVNISDGRVSSSVVVASGATYGIVDYTPLSQGLKTFTVSHTGQAGISDPTANLTTNVDSNDAEVFLERPKGRRYEGYTGKYVAT